MLLRDVSAAAALLLLCVQCLHGSALPAVSSYEFTAYRMQQYNLAQQKHGEFRELHPTAVVESHFGCLLCAYRKYSAEVVYWNISILHYFIILLQ